MKKTSTLLVTAIMAFGLLLTITATSHALNKPTHKLINTYIAQNTLDGFSVDSYLRDQLGFQEGKESEFNSRSAQDWIEDGGAFEDEPIYLRSVNHFHNPLTKQGFTDLDHWYLAWGFFGLLNGQSSIQWSQRAVNSQSPGGHYSWFDVRDYFYKALTSTDQATRDQNFADTFRGLGQLMHLVEDLSVPEHTRNKFHGQPWNYGYEDWVQDNITDDVNSRFYIGNYTSLFFDPSKIGQAPASALSNLGAVPITNLFDTDQYNGTNPNVTLQNDIGLSEYTNANFLCPGTMFTADFPYPDWNSMVQNAAPDPVTGKWYIKKLGMNETGTGGQVGNGEHIDHVALSRWGSKLLPPSISQSGVSLKMDKQVYADYASHLIPRAVGYAADLLDYFFRGQLEAVNPQVIKDNAGNITGAKLKIKNNTPNETMESGKVVVSYEYNGSVYGVSDEVQLKKGIASGAESQTDYTFNLNGVIPANAQEVKYWLVFRGKLGNEDDAVAGKVKPMLFLSACNGDGRRLYSLRRRIESDKIRFPDRACPLSATGSEQIRDHIFWLFIFVSSHGCRFQG
jgi:hypothetical protein